MTGNEVLTAYNITSALSIASLIASTVLPLVLVPLLYTYLDDLKGLFGATIRKAAGRPAAHRRGRGA